MLSQAEILARLLHNHARSLNPADRNSVAAEGLQSRSLETVGGVDGRAISGFLQAGIEQRCMLLAADPPSQRLSCAWTYVLSPP